MKKNIIDFDAVRTLRNGFIGLCFGPLVHLYYEFSDTILPVEVGINRLYKICMDQTIYLAGMFYIYIYIYIDRYCVFYIFCYLLLLTTTTI